MLLIVPADPLNPRRVDEHFRGQAEAARDAGIDVARVDHDVLSRAGMAAAEAVRGVRASDDAVYRGWMLTGGQYAAMAAALAAREVTLRTGAEAYRAAHELPGWYDALADVTPESVWMDGTDPTEFEALCGRLGSGPAVLRDFVKSMKHYWDEAAYIPDVADAAAAGKVAARFIELRDEDLAGGLVLRRYEEFTGAEVRTWWVDGRCVLVTPHPDSPDEEPPSDVELSVVSPPALPFVTVDLTRRADGVWRVVELGDGQVSDWPSSWDPARLVCALASRGG